MNSSDAAKVAEVTATLLGEPNGYLMPTPRPRWKRALARFFPTQQVPRPDPSTFFVFAHIETHFDWKDRLRILFVGRLTTECVIETNVAVERTKPTVTQYVPLP